MSEVATFIQFNHDSIEVRRVGIIAAFASFRWPAFKDSMAPENSAKLSMLDQKENFLSYMPGE